MSSTESHTARSNDPLFQSARTLTRRARIVLYWERYALIYALPVLALAVFIISSSVGLWERLGDPVRLLALIGLVYLWGRAFWHASKTPRPTRSDARRRVESDSGQAHRPLDTLHDTPALNDTLWDQHYQKATAQVATLKPAKAVPTLAPQDRYALRFIAPAVLVLALLLGAGDNFERLLRSLTPIWQAGVNPSAARFEAWIDPPEYTGRPPIYLKDKSEADIPAGSEFVARVYGTRNAPRLKLSTDKGRKYLRLERLDPKSFEARTTITDSATARWRLGEKRQVWTLNAVKDTPPMVAFEDTPSADKRDRLAFTASYSDDYGITNLTLVMQRLIDTEAESLDQETLNIPLPSASVKRGDKRKTALDLTKNRWAGEKVSAVLKATDGLGQTSESERVYFTIPDKIFIEPLAKAVSEQRRLVMQGTGDYAPLPRLSRKDWANRPYFDSYEPEFRLDRAPETVQRAALLIESITDSPAGLYRDPAVFMGLKNVLGRLRYARSQDDLKGLPAELWSISLRAEFGVLGTALEEMKEAERNLREGLARRAPQREIDTLFDRYDTAVDNYMEELRRQAIENGDVQQAGDGAGGGDTRNMDEIEELMKAIEEANRMGDVQGARKMLARLAELLENMQIQLTQGGGGSGDGDPQDEMSEEMQKSLEELADLLGQQRELKDETQQAEKQQLLDQLGGQTKGDETSPEDKAQTSPEALAEQQEQIEALLERLKEEGPASGTEGGDPSDEAQSDEAQGGKDGDERKNEGIGALSEDAEDALGRAARAMQESREALSQDALREAGQSQQEAIEALREAGEALAELAAEGREDQQNAEADGEDGNNPLGQSNDGQNDNEYDAEFDDRDNAQRSRELLEELRRRAAEQERRKIEREYLERLLKRF